MATHPRSLRLLLLTGMLLILVLVLRARAPRLPELQRVRVAALEPAQRTVPIERFLTAERSPDAVNAALSRASEFSARTGSAIVFGPDTLESRGGVVLQEGTRFVGRGGVIRRSEDARSSYLFVIGGSGITIEGLGIDFNGAGAYAAAFAIRNGGVHDLEFLDLHLFDGNEPDPTSNYGDRWGILIAPVAGPVEPVQDLHIRGNHVEDGIQLTAGYGNRGVKGVWIEDNRVVEPEENGIALVMAGGPGGLENVHVRRNEIIGARGIGIFIGVDRDTQAGTFVREVRIENNRIRGFTHPRRGTFGILFRAAELGNEGIVIRDNTIDGSGSRNAVGLRLQAKRQVNPNLGAGEVRFFSAPVVERNEFRSVSPAIDLWHTRGGVVRGNRGDMPRFIEIRDGSSGVEVRGNTNRAGSIERPAAGAGEGS